MTGEKKSNKPHLVNWDIVCRPKDQGGLGILDLRCMNLCLLAKWWWSLENKEGLWQKIVRFKYIRGRPLSLLQRKQGDSHFWKSILEVKDVFYKNCKRIIGDGKSTSFWNDCWCGNIPLSVRFKRLHDLSLDKEISVEKVISTNSESLTFRRRLVGAGADNLKEMISSYEDICLNDSRDNVIWLLDKKGFSVKSLYLNCRNNLGRVPYMFIWNAKIPQRIKVFLWLLLRDRILSKANLSKRNWQGNINCTWCDCLETTQHIFFDCQIAKFTWRVVQVVLHPICIPMNPSEMFSHWLHLFNKRDRNLLTVGCSAVLWTLWKIRNEACFEDKRIVNTLDIFVLCYFWMNSWTLLQKKSARRMLEERSIHIRKMASEFFSRAWGWSPVDRRLTQ